MKEILLNQGQVALVGDEDYEWLSQWKWYLIKNNELSYAYRASTANEIRQGSIKTIRMHRVIMNCPNGLQIDHIDGNGLNNQRDNLRIVTTRQNNQNRHDKRSSIYPGVNWHKRDKKWRAIIVCNGKKILLGFYNSEINAFKAYYDAVLNLGETVIGFAYPEIPEDEIETYDPPRKNKAKPVRGINVYDSSKVIEFSSMFEAQRSGGFSMWAIKSNCLGKTESHQDYKWEYL